MSVGSQLNRVVPTPKVGQQCSSVCPARPTAYSESLHLQSNLRQLGAHRRGLKWPFSHSDAPLCDDYDGLKREDIWDDYAVKMEIEKSGDCSVL